jgi:hypothetical protein
MAEGVGFEPTVGYPTLDFESSALNRTQPPFHFRKAAVPGADYQLRVCYCKLRSRTKRRRAEEATDFKSRYDRW